MNRKKFFVITTAVLVFSTAVFTIFVFFPELIGIRTVNTDKVTVISSPVNIETEYQDLQEGLSLSSPITAITSFELTNRYLPDNWKDKKISFKYTYLGEYSDDVYSQLNTLLKTDYNWKNELDENGDILLGGPMFIKDGVYQLHVHNTLYLASKYYLLGDLLDYLRSKDLLVGTMMKLGNVKLECMWSEELHVLTDNSVPADVDLIISTCLDRHGDYRLVSGWKVVNQ